MVTSTTSPPSSTKLCLTRQRCAPYAHAVSALQLGIRVLIKQHEASLGKVKAWLLGTCYLGSEG